ncbi:MAG: hypothetical protein KDB61_06190, partial [Planctomycetes bacterium]|nr:hypothetical protein [Planctomycetota bacterium]
MNRKKRILKIVGISLLAILFLGYFAFSTFLFKPFESAWPHSLAGLIPRQVDFFLSKENLEDDFKGFPRLAAMDSISRLNAWDTWINSPQYKELDAKNDLDGLLANIETQVSQLPMGLEPLDIFGGQEIAVSGYFNGKGVENSRWTLSGRVGWAGKMAVAALRYPSMLQKATGQAYSVQSDDGVYSVTGGTLKAPIYVTRVQDVVILGNDRALVAKGPELRDLGGTDSLAISAPYNDQIKKVESRVGAKGVEVKLDVGKAFAAFGVDGPWPDTRSPMFSQAFMGRLIQAPSCQDVLGLVRFQNGLRVDLSGAFSSESVTPFQSRLYRVNGFDRSKMLRDAARMAPADCVLFAYMHGPVTDLLRQVFDSVEPAMRANFEDAIKSTGHYKNLDELLEVLGLSLRNRLALIVRENDYGPVVAKNAAGQEFPAETDGQPVFAITLVTWTDGEASHARLDDIRDMIGRNPEKFGLQGYDPANPNETGYYVFDSDGFPTREFWSPFIPGTGMMATMITDQGHFWITNHEQMFSTIRQTYYQGESRGYPRLSELPEFRIQVENALDTANLVVWFNPKKAAPTLRKMAKQWARDNAGSNIDWRQERKRTEREVLKESFNGRSIGSLSPGDVDAVQAEVDARLTAWGDQLIADNVPLLIADKEREITYMESLENVLFMLR